MILLDYIKNRRYFFSFVEFLNSVRIIQEAPIEVRRFCFIIIIVVDIYFYVLTYERYIDRYHVLIELLLDDRSDYTHDLYKSGQLTLALMAELIEH